jgi:protein-S-isoprenylcysteine O-methyltransferase Ste14
VISPRFEDFLGKAVSIYVFAFLIWVQGHSVVDMARDPAAVHHWELAITARTLGLVFLIMVVYLTFTRHPPKRNAAGLEPRITAIAGTFTLMALVVLPTGEIPVEWRWISILLIATGQALSIVSLYRLGRSFSIMASARSLVTTGPYSVVRHPLYAAEAISATGLLISNWSWSALIVGVVHFAFQFRRMHNEEQVLRSEFAEYQEYAAKVAMILPRLPRSPFGPSRP